MDAVHAVSSLAHADAGERGTARPMALERIDWPRDEASGKLNLRRKTFDSMAKARPEL